MGGKKFTFQKAPYTENNNQQIEYQVKRMERKMEPFQVRVFRRIELIRPL